MTRPAHGRDRLRLDRRVTVSVVVGAIAVCGMIVLGMEPRLTMVGFVFFAVAAATWLVVDVGAIAAPVLWTDYGVRDDTRPRSDHRVRALSSQLRRSQRRGATRPPGPTDRPVSPGDDVALALVAVIDDHLLAEFGIDRSRDPAAASRILGRELTGFVTDIEVQRSMTGRRSLAHTVALVEDLCDRSPSG